VLTPLAAWAGFYVIVGSSAAALTGLQFVVMALIAGGRRRGSFSQIDAFGTPTIVHFCVTLLVSAILSAPWQRLSSVAVALGACGLFGVVYALVVLRRARSQTGYAPVLEDWIWHSALPLIAYAVLLAAAVAFARHPAPALFMIAAATFLLLFIGIHNAWDTVTYIAVEWLQAPDDSGNKSQ
jgi:hypothetical protein